MGKSSALCVRRERNKEGSAETKESWEKKQNIFCLCCLKIQSLLQRSVPLSPRELF